MPKKKTTEEFVADARKVHGDKYGYDKVIYDGTLEKVTITCPEHGDFEQSPCNHLQGRGCRLCGSISSANALSKGHQDFIKECKGIHGDVYDYSKTFYINKLSKVTITCPKHGDFEQRPKVHRKGGGCPLCANLKAANKRRSNLDEFIKKSREVHGDKYVYDKVVYVATMEKVTITCPEHGDFEQRPNHHMKGQNCPACALRIKLSKTTNTTKDFVSSSRRVHGSKYAYSKVDYKGNYKKVTITCPEHGDFEQRPSRHLIGQGCPKCQKSWSGDGAVYVMSSPEGYNKVGIAKSGTEHVRLQQILRSQQQKAPTSITGLSLVCAYSFNDGSFTEARRFEGKAHRHFKARRKQFSDKFDGSGEFFTVPVSEICSYLEQQGGKLVTIKQ